VNQAHPGELRELVAQLSDGTAASGDVARLNELLKADPIAQEQYLDHMLIDGLLEREFGGARAVAPHDAARAQGPHAGRSPRLSWTGWIATPLLLAALGIVVAFTWNPSARALTVRPLALADSGFEKGLLAPASAPAKSAWYGDVAHVVGDYSDVTPLEGSRMLRFVKSTVDPEHACELHQVVDLSTMSDAISRRPMSVEASAFFNAVPEHLDPNDYAFGIKVYAFSEDPSTLPHLWPVKWEDALTFSGSQTRADTDSRSWQQVKTRLPLPAETKYLVVQIAVSRPESESTSGEFPGQFADNVALKLVRLQ
jgi:hypothetical protein